MYVVERLRNLSQIPHAEVRESVFDRPLAFALEVTLGMSDITSHKGCAARKTKIPVYFQVNRRATTFLEELTYGDFCPVLFPLHRGGVAHFSYR